MTSTYRQQHGPPDIRGGLRGFMSTQTHLPPPAPNNTTQTTTSADVQQEDFPEATSEPVAEPIDSSSGPVLHTCVLCSTTFNGEELIKIKFPFECDVCHERNYCSNCIKDWFVDACKNEAKMPPKCCRAIPLRFVVEHLSNTELDLFKAKHLEWSTADRLYCPVSSCSAFIPPRLYIEPTSATGPSEEALAKKSSVSCPDCNTLVCTKCRTEMPHAECPKTDVDPKLAALLKKWMIKRCPKCRTGVRKVYGCPHVQCRCGSNFCFVCLQPIIECGGGCGDEDDEEDEDDVAEEEFRETIDADDLDGMARFYDGDGYDFGEEPQPSAVDTWGCEHRWSELQQEGIVTPNDLHQPLECHNCFRSITASESKANTMTDSDDDHQTHAENLASLESWVIEWQTRRTIESFWRCYCGDLFCRNCFCRPPPERALDTSWMWKCNCGRECGLCDRDRATRLKRVDAAKAAAAATTAEESAKKGWDCRCGKMICGSCKSSEAGD